MTKIDSKISRKDASKLLKVSMRTVDRYVKAGKLSLSTVDKRVFLDREEVLAFRGGRQVVDMSRHVVSIDKVVDTVDKTVVKKDKNVYTVSTPKSRPQNNIVEIYEKLFSKFRAELHERQERLEIANYRLGQIEAQLRNSVSSFDYNKEKFLRDKEEGDLKNKIEESNSIIQRILYKLKYEKLIKKVYLLILLIILALQPLWLLVIYK